MIVTRTPLRITLGGGGTDLPSYYSNYGGFLVSATINKYVYIILNPRFENSIRVSYSKTEIAENVDAVQHPIVREALRLVGLGPGLEIVSVADLPSNTGLGSSSTFTVGLLNALHTFKRDHVSPAQLAEEAYTIEVEILKEPIGKQDQYIGAFGGIARLEIERDGQVKVSPLKIHEHGIQEFENNVLLYYTGIQRKSSDVLEQQNQAVETKQGKEVAAMHQIKSIGMEINTCLESGNIDQFGKLLHRHWEIKKLLSDKVSTEQIDLWQDIGLQNGALGGKIMGAGGGGFFMFCCPNNHKTQLRQAMAAQGLTEMRYAIEPEGSKVLVNI